MLRLIGDRCDATRQGEARHATFCGRQRRVVLSSPESVGPNGKITLVKCFAGLAPPCSTYVRVQREDSQAALIFNAAAPNSTHLFHTLHAAHGVLRGCGYVSWPDYNLPHETNAYVPAQCLPSLPLPLVRTRIESEVLNRIETVASVAAH